MSPSETSRPAPRAQLRDNTILKGLLGRKRHCILMSRRDSLIPQQGRYIGFVFARGIWISGPKAAQVTSSLSYYTPQGPCKSFNLNVEGNQSSCDFLKENGSHTQEKKRWKIHESFGWLKCMKLLKLVRWGTTELIHQVQPTIISTRSVKESIQNLSPDQ